MWIKTNHGRWYNKEENLYQCTECKDYLPKSAFSVRPKYIVGVNGICYGCRRTTKIDKTVDGIVYSRISSRNPYVNKEHNVMLCAICGDVTRYNSAIGKCPTCAASYNSIVKAKDRNALGDAYIKRGIGLKLNRTLGETVKTEIDEDTVHLFKVLATANRKVSLYLKDKNASTLYKIKVGTIVTNGKLIYKNGTQKS